MSITLPKIAPKPGRGTLKCYHCRQAFPVKEGAWHSWEKMEVYLCKRCDAETTGRPERNRSRAR
jgi:hypothetical protein